MSQEWLNKSLIESVRAGGDKAITFVSAGEIESLKSCRAVLVYGINSEKAASAVQAVLTDFFGEKKECTFMRGDNKTEMRIGEIASCGGFGADCSVFAEEDEFLKKERYDYADLVHMVSLLRAPGGCPWDRAQTNESIKSNVVEEAYELADAIERGDDAGILEETGDVLLQAAFHSVL